MVNPLTIPIIEFFQFIPLLLIFRSHHILEPRTQGKIERYHRSMKNVVKLDNYYYPEQLKEALGEFVHYYNHQR